MDLHGQQVGNVLIMSCHALCPAQVGLVLFGPGAQFLSTKKQLIEITHCLHANQ